MNEKMLIEYLEKTYGYNEPIFINELQLDDISDNAIRQSFKRMVKSGILMRFDTGIYYMPKTTGLLNKSYLNPMKVIIRKYVQNDTDVFGYFSGATFANQLGITTQMPATIEIITNKEVTNGRTVTLGGQSIRLKRPAIPVNQENVVLQQFLDAVSQADKYSELSNTETYNLLRNYMRTKKFTQKQLIEITPVLSGQTAKKLIEGGLIYEFTPQ